MQSKLVEDNLVIARKLASKYHNRHGHLEYDEILSFATLGLIDAASRFDPSRGMQFATFAGKRVVGAIIDGLRREYGEGKRRRKPIELTRAGFIENEHSTPPVDFVQRDKLAQLRESFHILTPLERMVIESKLDGVSHIELSCGSSYSKTWLHKAEKRAVLKLQEHLGIK